MANPSEYVETRDLADHRIVSLPRNTVAPQRVKGNTYAFDVAAAAEFEQWPDEASQSASLLGGPADTSAVPSAAICVFHDTAYEDFGQEVPLEVVRNPKTLVSRGSGGLVQAGEGEDRHWTTAERIAEQDLHAWLDEKHTGPGRDPRVLPLVRATRQHRYPSLRDALAVMVKSAVTPTYWLLRGRSACEDLSNLDRKSGEELGGFSIVFSPD